MSLLQLYMPWRSRLIWCWFCIILSGKSSFLWSFCLSADGHTNGKSAFFHIQWTQRLLNLNRPSIDYWMPNPAWVCVWISYYNIVNRWSKRRQTHQCPPCSYLVGSHSRILKSRSLLQWNVLCVAICSHIGRDYLGAEWRERGGHHVATWIPPLLVTSRCGKSQPMHFQLNTAMVGSLAPSSVILLLMLIWYVSKEKGRPLCIHDVIWYVYAVWRNPI